MQFFAAHCGPAAEMSPSWPVCSGQQSSFFSCALQEISLLAGMTLETAWIVSACHSMLRAGSKG